MAAVTDTGEVSASGSCMPGATSEHMAAAAATAAATAAAYGGSGQACSNSPPSSHSKHNSSHSSLGQPCQGLDLSQDCHQQQQQEQEEPRVQQQLHQQEKLEHQRQARPQLHRQPSVESWQQSGQQQSQQVWVVDDAAELACDEEMLSDCSADEQEQHDAAAQQHSRGVSADDAMCLSGAGYGAGYRRAAGSEAAEVEQVSSAAAPAGAGASAGASAAASAAASGVSEDEGWCDEDMDPLDGLLQLAAAAERASKRWVASNEIWTSEDGLKVWPKVRRLLLRLVLGGEEAYSHSCFCCSCRYHCVYAESCRRLQSCWRVGANRVVVRVGAA